MKKIILASSNKGKIREIRESLQDLPIELISQTQFEIKDAEETGLTFVENAILKARHAAVESGLPALADDSGLCVEALAGRPGVYSARYAGPNGRDADLIEKLLREMQKVSNRKATFHCVLVLLQHPQDPTPLVCHGIWHGEILEAGQGQQGFGYDPVFYVPDYKCSAAELPSSLKNEISHRGMAMKQLKAALTNVRVL
jgi:XTP/dITP diphosphohydrolase